MSQEKNIKVETKGSSLPVRREESLTLKASPVADIYEAQDAFVVALDLPGAHKQSIEVVVEPGTLSVRGSVQPRTETTGRMIHREIAWNTYERSFRLGPGIDEKNIRAEFLDGVLTVVLPKTEESKARQIRIQ